MSGVTATVGVPADAVMVEYADITMLPLIAHGATRQQASCAGYDLWTQVLAPMTGSPPGQPARGSSVRCVAGQIADTSAQLATTAPKAAPTARMQAADVARLLWLARATERSMLGAMPLIAARSAHDLAHGRPRRRRAAFLLDRLDAEVDATLDAAWHALLHARFEGRPWLTHGKLNERQRPIWTPGVGLEWREVTGMRGAGGW